MYKRIFRFFTIVMLVLNLSAMFSVSASANSAPLPDMTIVFRNIPESGICAALLTEHDAADTFRISYTHTSMAAMMSKDTVPGADPEVMSAFESYDDPEGFIYSGWYYVVTNDYLQKISIYMSTTNENDRFRLLVYYPDSKTVRASSTLSCYAVESRFYADAGSGGDTLDAGIDYDFIGAGLALFCRIALTVAVEMLAALAFRFKGKVQFLTILIVNIITQVLLNIGLNLYYFFLYGGLFLLVSYFNWEVIVFVIEAIVYFAVFKSKNERVSGVRSTVYAFVANLLSFIAGVWLAAWLPGVF